MEPVIRQQTGEMCHIAFAVRPKYLRGGFFLGMQAAFATLAQDSALTRETYRVLLHLFSILDFENETGIAHADIATQLDMRTQQVSRAMKILMERGYIHRTGKHGKFWKYKIDPDVVFKGRAKNIETVKREIQTAKREAERANLTVIDGGRKINESHLGEPTMFDETEQ